MDATVIPWERMKQFIGQAAVLADYSGGFGVTGCDLNNSGFWAVYIRQSTREQAENDRAVEYLFTCAKLAKIKGLIVPAEYIIYDAKVSEDFNRPGMIHLRGELIGGRLIAGVIIPSQGRLTMEPHHQLTFEKECQHYGVQVVYGDAPSGNDWSSETSRVVQAQANKLRVITNRENARAGSIKRVILGNVPAGRAPYGYIYHRDAAEDRRGHIRILRAWWEIDGLEADGELSWGSAGWVVRKIFAWVGSEGRTQYWVAATLNGLRTEAPTLFNPLYGKMWAPKMVGEICRRECYTGKAAYNKSGRVPNLDKPLGDITMGVKRTLLRPKPASERVQFTVPPLTTQELWDSANKNLTERGRGRGKQGKKVQALLRGRLMCPRCGKPMAVKRKKTGEVYYHCRAHYCKWLDDPCLYSRFIPSSWDDQIWLEICDKLKEDAWIARRLSDELQKNEGVQRAIDQQEGKIRQYNTRISKVKDGYEGGLYSMNDAKARSVKYDQAIGECRTEIAQLRNEARFLTPGQISNLRAELISIRNRRLECPTFDEKAEVVARLGIKVYPSEDLKSRRIRCTVGIPKNNCEGEQGGSAKVVLGRPYRSRTCDTLIKRYKPLVMSSDNP